MQSSPRDENLLQAGILPYRGRLEIATGINVKGSPWEVTCRDTVRNSMDSSYGKLWTVFRKDEQPWERQKHFTPRLSPVTLSLTLSSHLTPDTPSLSHRWAYPALT